MLLSKETLTRLGCYLRQAERTFDRALHTDWQQARGYYGGKLGEELRCLVEEFPAEVAATSEAELAALRFRWGARGVFPRLFRLAETRLASLLQRRYTFDDAELRLFVSTLRRVLGFVVNQERPAQEALIQLRMDASFSVYLIRMRYGAYLDFDRIMKVEHLLQSEHTRSYTVDEIMGNQQS